MAAYELSYQAKMDLRNIYQYGVFQYGEKQADQYYMSLFNCFDKITENPYLYVAVDHIRHGYRRSVFGVHSIYYRIVNTNVEIIRILGRQDTTQAL